MAYLIFLAAIQGMMLTVLPSANIQTPGWDYEGGPRIVHDAKIMICRPDVGLKTSCSYANNMELWPCPMNSCPTPVLSI